MAKSRKSLVIPRTSAFKKQNGRCYYCNQPMWLKEPEELTVRYNISSGQASLLQCTGEHLLAHQAGGSAMRSNIVAACRYCNIHRHRSRKPAEPEIYKQRVRTRIGRRRWHGILIAAVSSISKGAGVI